MSNGAVVTTRVVDQWQMQATTGGDFNRTDELCDYVTGRDQIDVMAALPLQGQHHSGQFIQPDLTSRALVADIPVLAIVAAQITPAEKDAARTARAS